MIHTFALQSLHFQEENFLNLKSYTLIETLELCTLKWQLMVVWFIYSLEEITVSLGNIIFLCHFIIGKYTETIL